VADAQEILVYSGSEMISCASYGISGKEDMGGF